ncbi:type II secretion system protein [Bacillaceae bacterium CLA-AA-H227]|uniref:Type II secretion system protein n=1 Tax=Robertmurraya yapensis (ex Hitch et al 2024) TaxID=3133160 RepID=A0ACC6SHU5_9BACI
MIKNLKKRLKNQRGLTLVELLAVIVILGIISAIAVPSIGGIIEKSKEDAIKADALQVLNAAKLYVASNDVTEETTLANATTTGVDGTLDDLLDTKPNTVYSITITPDGGKYEYTDITVTRDGKTIESATEEQVLSNADIVDDVKSN